MVEKLTTFDYIKTKKSSPTQKLAGSVFYLLYGIYVQYRTSVLVQESAQIIKSPIILNSNESVSSFLENEVTLKSDLPSTFFKSSWVCDAMIFDCLNKGFVLLFFY